MKNGDKIIRQVRHTVRVYDDGLLDIIDSLGSLEKYRSNNSIILDALKIGLPELFKKEFSKKTDFNEKKNADILPGQLQMNLKRLNRMERTLDEVFVMQNIQERLLSTLYNTRVAEAAGETVTAEAITGGILSELPEEFDEIKKDMLKIYKEKP